MMGGGKEMGKERGGWGRKVGLSEVVRKERMGKGKEREEKWRHK